MLRLVKKSIFYVRSWPLFPRGARAVSPPQSLLPRALLRALLPFVYAFSRLPYTHCSFRFFASFSSGVCVISCGKSRGCAVSLSLAICTLERCRGSERTKDYAEARCSADLCFFLFFRLGRAQRAMFNIRNAFIFPSVSR